MSTSNPDSKSYWAWGAVVFVAVLLGSWVSNQGQSFLGWLLAGALMGVGVMLTLVPNEERSLVKWLYALTVPGVASYLAFTLLN